ncbi:MAG TPA: hypothetical protein DCS82_06530, partial [Rhodospirillaceae bacterium]|nr:hypothetical protein [Rhodospirillaceae bacterium]
MKLAFKGDLLDYVLGGLEKELNKAINSYSADVKKAEASMKSAQADIDKEEKKVDDAFKSATKDLDKAADAIEKAIKKVNGIQKDIREKKDKIGDKEHELHHL